jgi:LmbE family N-acetylglucosaminyl deacetylase
MLTRFSAMMFAAAVLLAAADARTVLAVFAHPDDETVAGPLLAKYAREGSKVHLVTLTAGQLGTTDHAKIPAGDQLAAVRAKELACAAEKLGLAGHRLFEFKDQGFAVGWDAQPMNQAADRVRQAIDSLRPDVVITWGPDGGTGHPDHRTASNITTQAFQQRSLLKHQPKKLYYVVWPDDGDSSGGFAAGRKVSREFITTEVDAARFLQPAFEAVQCHKSQWTREQMAAMSRMSEGRRGRVSLRLALSSVGMPQSVEKDIFERLP